MYIYLSLLLDVNFKCHCSMEHALGRLVLYVLPDQILYLLIYIYILFLTSMNNIKERFVIWVLLLIKQFPPRDLPLHILNSILNVPIQLHAQHS